MDDDIEWIRDQAGSGSASKKKVAFKGSVQLKYAWVYLRKTLNISIYSRSIPRSLNLDVVKLHLRVFSLDFVR